MKPDLEKARHQVERNQYHHGMRQERLGGPIAYGQVVGAARFNTAVRETEFARAVRSTVEAFQEFTRTWNGPFKRSPEASA